MAVSSERPPLPGSPSGYESHRSPPGSPAFSRGSSKTNLNRTLSPSPRNFSTMPLSPMAGTEDFSTMPLSHMKTMQSTGRMVRPLYAERQLHGGPLDPSVPVTPFMSDMDIQEDGAPHLRGCQILLPSWGEDNDSMRVRNTGRPLQRKIPLMPIMPRLVERKLLEPGFLRSYSEPSLPSSNSVSLPSVSVEARLLTVRRAAVKTPRGMRETVRKASKVQMHYPELVPCLRPRSPEFSPSSTMTSTFSKSSKSTMRKSVTWSDDKEKSKPSGRNLEELAKFAKRRSISMMDAMYSLRRAGQAADGPEFVGSSPPVSPSTGATPEGAGPAVDAAGPLAADASPSSDAAAAEAKAMELYATQKEPSPRANEKEMPLMVATLTDLLDTEAQLRATEECLTESVEPVCELGGARHPTTLISSRTLGVVKRKADLLHVVEERLGILRQHYEDRKRMAKEVANGAPAPPEMQKNNKFIFMYVHKDSMNNQGNPIDADKSNFDYFVGSFGLPCKHAALEEIKKLTKELAKWWSMEALTIANEGAGPDAIANLMAVVENLGTEKGGPEDAEIKNAMDEARKILGDLLADAVLKTAKALKEKDGFAVASSVNPMVEAAGKYAAQINADIKRATGLGAPTDHPSLEKAKSIATWFEEEVKNRIALRAFKNAEKIQVKDEEHAAMKEKADGIPPVGPGAEAAEKVEREIKQAIAEGCPADHELLAETKEIASALRAKDGERKRMANRAKRLAAEAAKKKAAEG